jgi:hypothetical protein
MRRPNARIISVKFTRTMVIPAPTAAKKSAIRIMERTMPIISKSTSDL